MSSLNFPLDNPVVIFAVILFIILFAPMLLNKIRIPSLIGLIIAGALIGPNGFNLILRDSSITLFVTVGLLYIMFLAGLEIDLAEFRKNSLKSFVFGMYTFWIPMIIGTFAGLYILNFSIKSSILLASMLASHTLITYPIVSKFGVAKNRAVNISIGGTMITDTLALLVLAAIAGMTDGSNDSFFWTKLITSVIIFAIIIFFGFPIIARWFFKRYSENILQYIFVLGMVFLAGFLAQLAGIEAIIGALFAGLTLNRMIPETSPLMNRIQFVGNALFIPFFLIGVGMLIDYRVFFHGWETIKVASIMTVAAIFSKFAAAWITQKTYNFSIDERRLIFGLSNSKAAATLAAVLVGYNIILGKNAYGVPIRLLSESILNGTILMIFITCTISSFITQKGARNIALDEASEEKVSISETEGAEKILIAVSNNANADELINLSLAVKSRKLTDNLYGLHIIEDSYPDNNSDKKAKKLLEQAASNASAVDNYLHQIIRYDINPLNGIVNVIREYKITDLILGLHEHKDISSSFLGNFTEGILSKCNTTTLIYKPHQPLSTIKRHLVVVPPKAEKEDGFPFWVSRLWSMSRNTGIPVVIYSSLSTRNILGDLVKKHPAEVSFKELSDWSDFLILSRDIKSDDNLIAIMSRPDMPSYQDAMQKVPFYLNKYFTSNSFMLVYPVQKIYSVEMKPASLIS